MNKHYLLHYGIKRKSGRYPWGSGKRPYQGDIIKSDFLLKKGTRVSRVGGTENEDFKNYRKYVSISESPDPGWKQFFVDLYSQQGKKYLYDKRYKTTKDMPVASANTTYKKFNEFANLNEQQQLKVFKSILQWSRESDDHPLEKNFANDFFNSLGSPGPGYEVRKEFFDFMKKEGYEAIADIAALRSGAMDSIIVLDPDRSLKMNKQYKVNIFDEKTGGLNYDWLWDIKKKV